MKIALALVFCLLTTILHALPPGVAERLQYYIDERVDRELNQCILVGVISQSGDEIYSAGTIQAGDATEPDKDTIFEIGGVTKVFTASAAADLVIEKKLTWKTTAAALLPVGAQPPIFDGILLNLHQLATHSTGLPPLPLDWKPADPAVPLADFDKDALYAGIPQTGYAFRPGSQYLHSELGYGLLGHLLELRMNEPYGDIIRRQITDPLELEDTVVELSADQFDRLAPPHDGVGQTKLWNWGVLQGAGALKSSLGDLMTFLKAQMGMYRNPKTNTFAVTHVPMLSTGAENTMTGYGWQITQKEGTTIYWHNGQTGGYASYIGFNPGRRIGVVILTNTSQSVDELGFYLLGPDVYPLGDFTPLRKLPERVLEQYIGTYQMTPESTITITRDGQRLYAQISGGSKYRIYPISLTRFGFAKGAITLNFETRGSRGPAPILKIEEKYGNYSAKRVKGK